jgi:hypothetical protein
MRLNNFGNLDVSKEMFQKILHKDASNNACRFTSQVIAYWAIVTACPPSAMKKIIMEKT